MKAAWGPGGRHTALWPAVLLLLLAGALRAYGVGRQALRGDEAFSVRFSAQPVGAIVAATGTAEPTTVLVSAARLDARR